MARMINMFIDILVEKVGRPICVQIYSSQHSKIDILCFVLFFVVFIEKTRLDISCEPPA